ncbi:helix-turn-helix transcriptional regulator [Longimicrobium sp.]|uniref:helix-turn-helix domain-containing protein n=1 Tax=Longimicrobium sp. TaxID=2029185 RepID=UPI002BE98AA0|nr:helix-turn-helix transcriptional regulator [Longimicrobium sp.]HSU16013.1 helix-turn-helix transcriptional regulator [Longimicrobium sp.]
MSDEPEFEYSSGNVFADGGLPDAEEALARSRLLYTITKTIRERGLTQAKAAKLLGTTQPTVSDMMRGKLHLFSLERLIAFLKALGHDVEIVVKPARRDPDEPVRATG